MAGMVAALEGFGSGPPKGSRRGLSAAERTSLRTCTATPLQTNSPGCTIGVWGSTEAGVGGEASLRAGLPIPLSPGLEAVAGSCGRIRLPTPSSQRSLPITGSIQACVHPQGFVRPSPGVQGCPPLGLRFPAALHPPKESPCHLHAQPELPLIVPALGTMIGSSGEHSGPGSVLWVQELPHQSWKPGVPGKAPHLKSWQELLSEACPLAVVSTPCSALALCGLPGSPRS